MIEPTVGRVVHFYNNKDVPPHAATIAAVHSDRCVNLAIVNHSGQPYSLTSVPLLQDDDKRPQGFFCEWMPYQKGQAAKIEELEAQINKN